MDVEESMLTSCVSVAPDPRIIRAMLKTLT